MLVVVVVVIVVVVVVVVVVVEIRDGKRQQTGGFQILLAWKSSGKEQSSATMRSMA